MVWPASIAIELAQDLPKKVLYPDTL